MRKHWLLLGVALLAAVLAIGAVACEDEEDGGAETPTVGLTPEGETPTVGETPEVAASVEIVAPEDGATVSSPVTLEVSASGVDIAAASDAVEGAAHFHAFVDQDPVAEGEVVPSDTEGIFHFADTQELELEPGAHTVTVVLGDNSHVRLAGVAEATVSFTVE